MKNFAEVEQLLYLNKKRIARKYNIKRIALFGSIVRGDFTASSDVDILVEFEKPIGLDFVLLADELEQLLNVKVDLVTLNSIKPLMFEKIKQELVYV
ncbi:MAG: hypothetical protein AUK34_05880 [Ignavibacteria bacterium CG2_30_36_16]|nr:nucleotidyltransferase family protein [Ignavibacteria bacterium]OIP60883.1 MAG: hypothetical protein AUK34_05880 [Ignavibacteria bacterium CG2_30_36_16]PJB01942.1 MAG: nucleotidyltransferase [Ignavibacteria bacterium CG_4_9_14_3_um_filter_36_18]